MKDYIKEIVDKNLSQEINKNRIREYLQEYFLYIIYRNKVYNSIVFCGGTALRFLYGIKRFSEDLDYSLSQNNKGYNFRNLISIVKRDFEAGGYVIEVQYDTSANVNNAFLKFPGLLFEFGLSAYKEEKLAIKLEVDVNPPSGGKEEVTIINKNFMIYTFHYALSSLFAGKLHAVLNRKYTKGRDWYDLLWYLTKFKDIKPNFVMLNNALIQTKSKIADINKDNWKSYLKSAIDSVDIEKARKDVYKFLEVPDEEELLTKENFYKAL